MIELGAAAKEDRHPARVGRANRGHFLVRELELGDESHAREPDGDEEEERRSEDAERTAGAGLPPGRPHQNLK
jgi:hypothetical protein